MDAIESPVIFIVGQTATGKTDLSLKLAKKYNGEVICADSRTIYKHMDIGTAKPTAEEQNVVSHYGLDLVEPDDHYSAAQFKKYAQEKIKIIRAKRKIPFVVGGTGLYIDGLLYNFSFSAGIDSQAREKFEQTDINKLQALANQAGISEEDVNFKNHRHLANAVARGGVIKQPKIKPEDHIVLGVDVEKDMMHKRIKARIDNMIEMGLVDEAESLVNKYGPNAPGLQTPAYKIFAEYLDDKISYSEARQRLARSDEQLAKRQKTWFKRNKDIIWIKNFTEADTEVENFISKFGTMSK